MLLPEAFEAQAARTPDAPALSCNGATLTYAALNARANRLAHHLIGRGVGPERVVSVCLERSVDLVVALLAVLKAGGAYLPVEPDYPGERVALMMREAGPVLTLTSRAAERDGEAALVLDRPETAALLARHPERNPCDADRIGPLRPANVAYVIYTSGSTGQPKGVVIEHRSLSLYLAWVCAMYPSVAGRALLHSPVAFDLTVTGLYAPLLSGGFVHLAGLEEASALRARDGLAPPTFLKITPSHLPLLLTLPDPIAPTGQLMVGGEMLLGATVGEWLRLYPKTTVINEYGPTETTVGCSTLCLTAGDAKQMGTVPIGRPTWDTRMHVLDADLHAVPVGVPGELCVAGGQVARGYLNRPAATAERFVPNPFGEPGSRMYRTGDLARCGADASLECLGRTDDQVKIRGYRVELTEIESVLARHADVAHVAVAVREDQPMARRLVAYVVPARGNEVDASELRGHVAAALPDYMVPDLFVAIASLPLTANGKLDRKSLPAPDLDSDEAFREPRTEHEALLCDLFAEVLGLHRVSCDADFFALGGDSVAAAWLAGRARRNGLRLTLDDLFRHRTPAALSAVRHASEQSRHVV